MGFRMVPGQKTLTFTTPSTANEVTQVTLPPGQSGVIVTVGSASVTTGDALIAHTGVDGDPITDATPVQNGASVGFDSGLTADKSELAIYIAPATDVALPISVQAVN